METGIYKGSNDNQFDKDWWFYKNGEGITKDDTVILEMYINFYKNL
jgi:hypothetical protein